MIKKFALLFLAVFSLHAANSQDDDKKFRFGLRIDPSLNWYKVDNDKKFANAGSSVGFGWGLHTELKLGDNASWTNAIGLFYDKGNVNYKVSSTTGDSVYYMLNGDDEQVAFTSDSVTTLPAGASLYRLGTRHYTVNYAHLQTCIKMKTKEIGYITYFGQFGLNLGIKTKARANDDSEILGSSGGFTSIQKEKIDVTKDAAFMKLGINIGFGLEFNISGSTSLFTCLSYNHGFTNAVTKSSDHLKTTNDQTGKLIDITQKFTARNIALTVGILF